MPFLNLFALDASTLLCALHFVASGFVLFATKKKDRKRQGRVSFLQYSSKCLSFETKE
jgi:hypothetical protein